MTLKDTDPMLKKRKRLKEEKSWRAIKQSGMPRVITADAKRRLWERWLKIFKISCVGLAVLGVVGFGYYFVKYEMGSSSFLGNQHQLRHIIIKTDGVLTEAAVKKFTDLNVGMDLLNVDIFELKERLEGISQVKSALVERLFPDTLKISLMEHQPIFKIVYLNEKGRREGLLVSTEGAIFKGIGYNREFLKELLFMEGVKLRKANGKFLPLVQVKSAVDLIVLAKNERPEMYKGWKSISFEYLEDVLNTHEDSFIKIKTKGYGEIIFTPQHYELQMNRLGAIVNYIHEGHLAHIERIDLSMDGQAAVQIAKNYAYKKI